MELAASSDTPESALDDPTFGGYARLQIDNSALQRYRDGMSPAVRAQFGKNILDVMLNSFLGEP
jgi:hypothetical protein